MGKISGPLLDRIDIHIDGAGGEVSRSAWRDCARDRWFRGNSRADDQSARTSSPAFAGDKIFSNAAMTPRMIYTFCHIDSNSEKMLETAMRRLGLSARAYDRILKVSRNIADLEGADATL